MNVYMVTFDGQDRIVEAPSCAAAVRIWSDSLISEWKRDGDFTPGDDPEPEQVVLLSEEPVIHSPEPDKP